MKRAFSTWLLSCSIIALMSTVHADDTMVVTIKASKKPSSPHEVQAKNGESNPVLPADGGDFLKQLNGVTGSRFGGRGIEPIIRGQSQTQLNVLLDGAYVHGGCPNRMDPPTSYAALETYEKVTVQKGVQTLQHGSGGSGGTVLFERDTRSLIDPVDGFSGKASATAMSNGVKHDVSADVVKANSKGYARAFAQDRQADNYEDGDGNTVRSAYKHRQAGVVLGVTPTDNRVLEYSYENNDFSDAYYAGAMDSPKEQGDIQRLKYKDKLDGKVKEIEAEAYVSNVEHLMDNYSLRTPTGMKMAVPTTSDTTGGKLALKSTVGNHTQVTYGVNIQNRERTATSQNISMNTDTGLMWPQAKTDQAGVFAEAETQLNPNDKLKYGVRVDKVQAKADKADVVLAGRTANQNYTALYGYGADQQDETNTGALLRYEKALSERTSVFTGASRSVRTADETERFINKWGAAAADRWVGNPQIKPEKHHQLDVGVTHKQGKTRVTGSVFADKVDDFILRDKLTTGANAGAQIYRNVDAELVGAEVGAETKLNDKFKLSGDMAYIKRTNTTDKRPIAQTPPVSGKVQLDYKGSQWGAGTRVRFAAGQDNIDEAMLGITEVGPSSGYGVLDAYGRYTLSKSTQLRFGMDNVLDKTYAEHVSRRNLEITDTITRVNEAGRTAWVKLETDF